jgi:hypothetical protein
LGPAARAYYFLTARLSREQRAVRKQLFGRFSEGFRPLRPFIWPGLSSELVEIPVTTMPLLKLPIHVSYLLYLSRYSVSLASSYFRTALALCRATGIQPSLLLHPLDFLGAEDDGDLGFFPAMNMPARKKLSVVTRAIDTLAAQFHVVTMRQHAAVIHHSPLRAIASDESAAALSLSANAR